MSYEERRIDVHVNCVVGVGSEEATARDEATVQALSTAIRDAVTPILTDGQFESVIVWYTLPNASDDH